jgi:hypothetical protein
VDYKGEPKTDHKTITGNKDAGDPFWVLWSRALESVHANDLDGAYLEILGSGDELLLVRMMGHTGPILQQLASTTVLQLVCTITQLLQQQSFLDCILPWIQQVHFLMLFPRHILFLRTSCELSNRDEELIKQLGED